MTNGVYKTLEKYLKELTFENTFAVRSTALKVALDVSDPGRLEVRRHGDRQTTTVHLLPGDDGWNYWHTHGRPTYIRVCRPGPNNRDLSRQMRTRADELLWDSVIY